MSVITVEMLGQIGEHKESISKFQKMFGGKEMKITPKNVLKASRKGLDMEWIASHFINSFNKEASLALPGIAFLYAKENGPDKDTRSAACKEPIYALKYAKEIDKCVCAETKEAVKTDWISQYGYDAFEKSLEEENVS